ncbi:hypothetical protein [Bradyrhizobium sp. JYMT SZCCT0428]|uniref:hypothetical protein n=1 Tax=Bradyrhizobium sp. JYMT SZCCT0428 TaxID=2807673 RepID=UPI001BA9884D|nr:hypothetical protein [Bradyrhizobium sp. JYMT SZCCT0428]MBR1149886.1 hypothetical protein [Bradyrhizobium sp. JYMT SZCCT0428]
MKKSDINAVEPAKPALEAPVQLTPEQLEIVAAGFRAAINRGTLGDIIKDITIFGRFPTPTMPVPTKTVLF